MAKMNTEDPDYFPELNTNILTVFINWFDGYLGSNFAQYLKKKPVSESAVEDENIPRSLPPTRIVGSCARVDREIPSYIEQVYNRDDARKLEEGWMSADVIIFDITDGGLEQLDEAEHAVEYFEEKIAAMKEPKVVILLSTIMTWVATKNKDVELPEDLMLPFTEEDYRRRRAHPKYKTHLLLEKEIIRIGTINRKMFRTYVVASGLIYGRGERELHFFMKNAWLNVPAVPCISKGENIVPMMYIDDLCLLIQRIIERKPKPPRYIVAADGNHQLMVDVIKIISQVLSNGALNPITIEEIFVTRELSIHQLDLLTANIKMESTVIQSLGVTPTFEGGFVAAAETVINQYKEARGLRPICIFLHGPPGIGKLKLAGALALHYHIHALEIESAVKEGIHEAELLLGMTEGDGEGDRETVEEYKYSGDEDEEESESLMTTVVEEDLGEEDEQQHEKIAAAREFLKMINDSKEKNNGEIELQVMLKILRGKMLSKPCQNQGYVLFDSPKTVDSAVELFGAPNTEPDEDKEKDFAQLPELVVNLDAPDGYVRNRVMKLSEMELVEWYGGEEGYLNQLAEYRANNNEENTVLNYFDALEIRIIHADIVAELDLTKLLESMKKILGPPRNFGPSPAELRERERHQAELDRRHREEAERQRDEEEREAAVHNALRQQEWVSRLEELRKEDEAALLASSLPMREYLMHHVMPALTESLADCVRIKPIDPIDFIAEQLVRHQHL